MKLIAKFCLLCALLMASANSYSQVKTEKDGFVWERFEMHGVKDAEGKVLFDPKLQYSVIYSTATDKGASLGHFRVDKYDPDKKVIYYGIADCKGNIILPIKYGAAHMRLDICGNDTLAYFDTKDDEDSKTKDFRDLTGKKLGSIPSDVQYDVDDEGYVVKWKTTERLGIKIPSANGHLANFHKPAVMKTIETPLGKFSCKKQITNGFEWCLLTNADGSIKGAMTMDEKILVPVEEKNKYIDCHDGYFFCKEETVGTKPGLASVCKTDGTIIIPKTEGLTWITLDSSTKKYFECTYSESTESKTREASLYDIEGNIIIPAGKFSDIDVRNDKDFVYIKANIGKNGTTFFDTDLKPIFHYPSGLYVVLHKDKLGFYYEVSDLKMEKKHTGILGENGEMIIKPGKYDFIRREVSDKFAYYKTSIRTGKGYDTLDGICDLAGNELIPNEYDFISDSSGKIVLKKGEDSYTANVDLSRPVKFQTLDEGGRKFLLTNSGEKINSVGYTSLTYDEQRFSYTAAIDGYSTKISPTGKEENPILEQIFNKAYALHDSNPAEAMKLYNRILDLDKDNKNLSLKSLACNNLGCIYQDNGDKAKAETLYRQSLEYAPTNQQAQNNLNKLYATAKETVVEERRMSGWDVAASVLGAFNQALGSYSQAMSGYGQNSYSPSGSGSTGSGNSANSANTDSRSAASVMSSYQMSSRAYSGYDDQLVRMMTYPNTYNDNVRRNLQAKMRQIREENNKDPKRPKISQSARETWNGK